MKSGMLAAEAVFESLKASPEQSGEEVASYQAAVESSWVWKELKSVRNYHPSFKYGLLGGVLYSGISAFVLRGMEPWTFHHSHTDSQATEPAAKHQPIEYPKPDGVLSFDLLSNLARAGTAHEHDQPSHLRIKEGMEDVPSAKSFKDFAAPESRFCPAGVYEYPEVRPLPQRVLVWRHVCGDLSRACFVCACAPPPPRPLLVQGDKLVINAQNCVHCKCCSIKMPDEYIRWTVPEAGGGGPS